MIRNTINLKGRCETAMTDSTTTASETYKKKNTRKKKNKKDSQLVIRIAAHDRDRFIELCEDMDTSAAREIRHFIRGFMKENSA